MTDPFVVDASILIQAYVRDPDSARVQTLLQGLNESEPITLYAPEFCLLECTNILWKHIRFNGMPIDIARQAVEEMRQLPLSLHPVVSHLSRALTVGLNHQLAIYDSLYIALAEALRCPLITVDERQAKAAAASGVTLKPITDFAEFSE